MCGVCTVGFVHLHDAVVEDVGIGQISLRLLSKFALDDPPSAMALLANCWSSSIFLLADLPSSPSIICATTLSISLCLINPSASWSNSNPIFVVSTMNLHKQSGQWTQLPGQLNGSRSEMKWKRPLRCCHQCEKERKRNQKNIKAYMLLMWMGDRSHLSWWCFIKLQIGVLPPFWEVVTMWYYGEISSLSWFVSIWNVEKWASWALEGSRRILSPFKSEQLEVSPTPISM